MIWYTIGTILITLLGGLGLFVAKSPKAQRWLKARVKRRWRGQKTEHGKRRTARGLTPRTQLRAKRKAEPLGLVALRKRAKNDPRTATRIVDKAKLAAANRKAARVDKPKTAPVTQRVLEAVNHDPAGTPRAEIPEGERCRATTEADGYQCGNRSRRAPDGTPLGYCYLPTHRNMVVGRARPKAWK